MYSVRSADKTTMAAIVGPRPAFRLLLPTPQLNALIEEALDGVMMQRGGELHMPE